MLVSSRERSSSVSFTQDLSRERLPPLYLLILEADNRARSLLKKVAKDHSFVVSEANDVATARAIIKRQAVDIVVLDPRLRGDRRSSFFEEVRALHPETEVIVSVPIEDLPSAIDAVKSGAIDYVTRPFEQQLVASVLDRSRQQLYAAIRSRRLRERFRGQKGTANLIGQSTTMQQLKKTIVHAAQSANPILIRGEQGVGKELVARSIHFASHRAAEPFLLVDCRALAPALRGSEIFGHARNAFRGAHSDQRGLLAAADAGSILLDEITELSMDVQAGLVRALREKKIKPVASMRSYPIAARVMATTSRDIGAMVDRGRFRKDLYALLNVSHISVSPLRKKPEDLEDLTQYFIERINQQTGLRRNLSSDIVEALQRYHWPGNVRELENAIEYACFHSSENLLRISDFPPVIQTLRSAMPNGQVPVPSHKNPNLPADDSLVGKSIAEIERYAILKTLAHHNGSITGAAKVLGLGRTTLYRKLKEYGVLGSTEN